MSIASPSDQCPPREETNGNIPNGRTVHFSFHIQGSSFTIFVDSSADSNFEPLGMFAAEDARAEDTEPSKAWDAHHQRVPWQALALPGRIAGSSDLFTSKPHAALVFCVTWAQTWAKLLVSREAARNRRLLALVKYAQRICLPELGLFLFGPS